MKLLQLLLLLAPLSLMAQNPPGGYGPGAGGITSNSPLPLATSGPGPVFNVQNYGAKGDSQSTGNANCTTASNTIITCTGTAFSQATDPSKNIFCSFGSGTEFNTLTTIVSVQSATSITVSQAANFSGSGVTCLYGTLADVGVSAAFTAALAASKGVSGNSGNKGIFTASPILYFPAGGYLLCTTLLNGLNVSGSVDGFTFLGDGVDQTFIYAGSGTTACPTTANGSLGSIIQIGNSANNININGFTFDGALNYNNGNVSNAVSHGGAGTIKNVNVQRWGGNGAQALNVGGSANLDSIGALGNLGPGIGCNSCKGDWNNIGSSNNGNAANLLINNVIGLNNSQGLRIRGATLVDECGSLPTGCTQISNSQDVWLIGAGLFATNSGKALTVYNNSFVHLAGGIIGTFGNDTNSTGLSVVAGSVVQASDTRFVSSGTGNCVLQAGILNDNGGNTCENMFPIASGTSAGTTAVLTLTTVGANVNTNCTVGDALIVEGAGIAGYNGYYPAGTTSGITAITATTLTYTTSGTNLGALSAGGVAFCRNLQSYSGTLPRALLNVPTTNTCYVTGTFGATVTGAPMCNARIPAATNITRITAASTTVTACTVAPVVTISDGTASVTLTITTAKSQWDSAVDASTGVGTTIFKPNGTLQITNTAGTCTTLPTNFSVSYNPAPILSN